MLSASLFKSIFDFRIWIPSVPIKEMIYLPMVQVSHFDHITVMYIHQLSVNVFSRLGVIDGGGQGKVRRQNYAY